MLAIKLLTFIFSIGPIYTSAFLSLLALSFLSAISNVIVFSLIDSLASSNIRPLIANLLPSIDLSSLASILLFAIIASAVLSVLVISLTNLYSSSLNVYLQKRILDNTIERQSLGQAEISKAKLVLCTYIGDLSNSCGRLLTIALNLITCLVLLLYTSISTSPYVLISGSVYLLAALLIFQANQRVIRSLSSSCDRALQSYYQILDNILDFNIELKSDSRIKSWISSSASSFFTSSSHLKARSRTLSSLPSTFLQYSLLFIIAVFLTRFSVSKESLSQLVAFLLIFLAKILPSAQSLLSNYNALSVSSSRIYTSLAFLHDSSSSRMIKPSLLDKAQAISASQTNLKSDGMGRSFYVHSDDLADQKKSLITLEPYDIIFPDSGYTLHIPNVNIRDSTLHVVKGKSGVGKSTFIMHIYSTLNQCLPSNSSFLPNSPGSIYFQLSSSFTLNMTLWDNIVCGRSFNSPQSDVVEHVLMIAKLLDLQDVVSFDNLFLMLNLSSLSSGQLQRIHLLRAFVFPPTLVILDEPTSRLDSHSTAAFIRTVSFIKESFGTSFLISSHSTDLCRSADVLFSISSSSSR